jgi:PKD repeat protein
LSLKKNKFDQFIPFTRIMRNISRYTNSKILIKICVVLLLLVLKTDIQSSKNSQNIAFSENIIDPLVGSYDNLIWNKSIGTEFTDRGYGLWANDTAIFTVGQSYNPNTGSVELILIKLDPLGNQIWNKTWIKDERASGTDVFCDGIYIYTVGSTSDITGDEDWVLIKWDSEGNELWNKTRGEILYSDQCLAVTADNGYIYTVGFDENYDDYNSVIVKWDANGNVIWIDYPVSVGWDKLTDIAVYNGEIYATGYTQETGNQPFGFRILKYSVEGVCLWDRIIYLPNINAFGEGIWCDSTGIYTVGNIQTNYVLESTLLIAKWDISGNQIWNNTFNSSGSDYGNSIWANGTHIFTGGATDGFGWGNEDFLLIQWDLNGNHQRNRTIGGAGGDHSYAIFGVGAEVYLGGTTSSFEGLENIFVAKVNPGEKLSAQAGFDKSYTPYYINQPVSFTFYGCEGDGIVDYQWDFGDLTTNVTERNPTHIFQTAGTFTIILTITDIYGDKSIATGSITIPNDHKPYSDFNMTGLFIVGEEITFTFNGTSVDWYDMIYWEFGDGYTNNEFYLQITHIYSTPGVKTVKLTIVDDDGDSDLAQYSIYIDPDNIPISNFTADKQLAPLGSLIRFDFTGSLTNTPGTYLWDFGDGTTSTDISPTHQYTTIGVYNVSLQVTDLDGDTDIECKEDFIEIYENLSPNPDFLISSTLIRPGEWIQVIYTGTTGNGGENYEWDFGDGTINSTDQNPFHQYINPGMYSISLTVSDREGDYGFITRSNCVIVFVSSTPEPDFFTENTIAKPYEPIQFIYNGSFGNGLVEFRWNFGDSSPNSTEMNPKHIFSESGVYTVKLTVIDSDGDIGIVEKVHYISIVSEYPEDTYPTADFMLNATEIYEGDQISCQFTGILGDGDHVFLWNFGDNTENQSGNAVTHQYTQAGFYSVALTVTDADGDAARIIKYNCIVVKELPVPENKIPIAEFSINMTQLNEGDWILVQFSGKLGDGDHDYHWNFGDGTQNQTGSIVTHQYTQSGFYSITLIVTDVDGDFTQLVKYNCIIVIAPSIIETEPTTSKWDTPILVGASAGLIAGGLVTLLGWALIQKKRIVA